MKKFNIALLPVDNSEKLVNFSQKFTSIKTQYQLGKKSYPHITLCQFYADEKDIDSIWENVCGVLDEYSIDLELKTFSCITFDNINFWISLIPSEVSQIHKMQAEISAILKLQNKKLYDPHLTLISTLDKTYESKATPLIQEYKAISGRFILSLGESDEIGQFVNLICQIDENHSPLISSKL